jgi:hypothetical protein
MGKVTPDFKQLDYTIENLSKQRDAIVQAKAIELYPNFKKMWSENDYGYEGGAFTREDALAEALAVLRGEK